MHENSTCAQHQQKNNPRLKTRQPKRGPGDHHIGLSVRPTSPQSLRHSSLPQVFSKPISLQFLDSFRFPSLSFVAASLHRSASQSCLVDLSAMPRVLESANLSRLVSSAAILCSGACIPAGRSSSLQHPSQLSQNLNLFPNRSPLLPSGREIFSFITRARRPCCLQADILKFPPLMSTSF